MDVDIDTPYITTLRFIIEGDIPEGNIGYKEPHEDIYLGGIKTFLDTALIMFHYSDTKPEFHIIEREIRGADSSGYKNELVYVFGFRNIEDSLEFKVLFEKACSLIR